MGNIIRLEVFTDFFTGVGSRKVPLEVGCLMTSIAYKMAIMGYGLRSGGAKGSDQAFELGVNKAIAAGLVSTAAKQIFYANDATPWAMNVAKAYHPAWNKMGEYAQKLHGRNAFQVLGRDLKSPSMGVICWTPDGCMTHAARAYKTGGTGTAISIADNYQVPISNLAVQTEFVKWRDWANGTGVKSSLR